MRVAALYDVHGNLPALEAALAAAANADVVVVGGDVCWGPMPAECLATLRALGERARWVRGNADREVADPPAGDALSAWCAERVGAEGRAFLGSLPTSVALDGVLYCHGSPRSDEECLTNGTPAERVRERVAGVRERVVVCGHTHAQFDRAVDGVRVVNAGSVGLPFGAPGAHWALVDGDAIDLRVTPYDVDAAAAAIRASGFPDGDEIAEHVLAPPPAETAVELWGDR